MATWFIRADKTWLWIGSQVDVDAWRFEHLLEAAADADRSGAASEALRLICEGLELWRGDYLADVINEQWAQLGVDRLRVRFTAACIRAAELLGAAGRTDEAAARANDALAIEPWSEAAFRPPPTSQLARARLRTA